MGSFLSGQATAETRCLGKDGGDLSCLYILESHGSCERGSHSQLSKRIQATARTHRRPARPARPASSQKKRKRSPWRPFVLLRGIQRFRSIYVLSSPSCLPHRLCIFPVPSAEHLARARDRGHGLHEAAGLSRLRVCSIDAAPWE